MFCYDSIFDLGVIVLLVKLYVGNGHVYICVPYLVHVRCSIGVAVTAVMVPFPMPYHVLATYIVPLQVMLHMQCFVVYYVRANFRVSSAQWCMKDLTICVNL